MNTTTRSSTAERFGRWLGHGWRACARRETQMSGWLVAKGLPEGGALVLPWLLKLALLAVLLYAAFWLALLLVFVIVAAWGAEHASASDDDDDDFLGHKAEERDHRDSLFYHPASYNDDPDPRFEDD
ncbi:MULTISPECIES: DUF3742 family protein [unclassified Brenneria]|uniref:DUF3742 family protein n=1 Tax=unclassified Brenneria TaxID=2634434 RepID=UPI0018F065AD|nr:DUF3742 family protein [Brenneria sp. L3-3C-1]MBJ7223547.1 DUF3742 family protein [Brenneria sp. L3-3C-1]MEE3644789.1 DUF3742 family protein [Brenneria sp. L3_3C_1]